MLSFIFCLVPPELWSKCLHVPCLQVGSDGEHAGPSQHNLLLQAHTGRQQRQRARQLRRNAPVANELDDVPSDDETHALPVSVLFMHTIVCVYSHFGWAQ